MADEQVLPVSSPKIIYYTDGSANPNPGWGGYAVIRDGEVHIVGGEPKATGKDPGYTTNIRMEGMAILMAMRDSAGMQAEIHTDSRFWINVLTKWAPSWKHYGWRKYKGEIQNLDLVKATYNTYEQLPNIQLKWVHGHAGQELNELADRYAKMARRLHITDPAYAKDVDWTWPPKHNQEEPTEATPSESMPKSTATD